MIAPLQTYFKRFHREPRQIHHKPQADLGMVWVIPCYNEPALLTTLDSLRYNDFPPCAVEIIVVLNAPANASPEHHHQNQRTLEELQSWAQEHTTPAFQVYPLWFPALPTKVAGVGTARKIGMDEAVDRFLQVKHPQGLIVCLDADCTVEPNYMTAIHNHFQQHPHSTGATIYFEHPLEQAPTPQHREAIAQYELHLRYYVQALHYAGIPSACHTVGSTMVVRADTYCKIGGMNRRKAGEDFYFLQKVANTGLLTEITSTRVLPSPRFSDRVPFGTGKAISQLLAFETGNHDPFDTIQNSPSSPTLALTPRAFPGLPIWYTYHPQSIEMLRLLCQQAPLRFASTSVDDQSWLVSLPQPLRHFLVDQNFLHKLQEIRANTTHAAAFAKRFFHWLDLFVAMKWVHFARDNGFPNVPVCEAATWLLAQCSQTDTLTPSEPIYGTECLLQRYRSLAFEWSHVVICSL